MTCVRETHQRPKIEYTFVNGYDEESTNAVKYPYKPDFENDGNVGVEDLMQLLSSFGMGFDVEEINIDELTLSDWISPGMVGCGSVGS
jgi:hypothetical protein